MAMSRYVLELLPTEVRICGLGCMIGGNGVFVGALMDSWYVAVICGVALLISILAGISLSRKSRADWNLCILSYRC